MDVTGDMQGQCSIWDQLSGLSLSRFNSISLNNIESLLLQQTGLNLLVTFFHVYLDET